MSDKKSVIENPDSFAERLQHFLTNERRNRFATFSGDQVQLDELKAHISRSEPIPSLEAMRHLIETAFYASIAREEGVDVTFSVIWADPDFARESDWPRLQFDQPLILDVEALRKLSPASDPELVDIALYDTGNGPEIWGLLFLREKKMGQRGFAPGLTIVVDSPGVLAVKSDPGLVGTYSRRVGVIVDEGAQIDKSVLIKLFARIFEGEQDFNERFFATSKILNFANEALVSGQGATLLVTPGRELPTGITFPKYGTELISRSQLSSRLADNSFLYLSKSISRIAFVDGAVAMNGQGVIYGFGGMIQVGASGDFEIGIVDSRDFFGNEKIIRLSEFSGGSRHRSALTFCYEHPGAVALVVSHDGVMSIMARADKKDRVIVFRPFYKAFDLGI